MRKPKANLFEYLENARQQQMALTKRFTQTQARITSVEERLQVLHKRQMENRQQEIAPATNGFLPTDGDLELEASFTGPQAEEEQETERLVPLHQVQADEQQVSPVLSAQAEVLQEPAGPEQV